MIAPNGEIVVNNASNARLTFVSPTGEVFRTVAHMPSGPVNRWVAWYTADARLVEVGKAERIDPVRGPISTDIRRTWSADFSRADTTWMMECAGFPSAPPEYSSFEVPSPGGRSYMGAGFPFTIGGRGRLHAPDGGFWIGAFPEYRTIHRVAFGTCNSTTTFALRGPVVDIPAAPYQEALTMLQTMARQAVGAPRAPDPGKLRRTLPYFDALAIDAFGRLWVERFVPGTITFAWTTPSGARRFDVYSPRGALVAEVGVPPRLCTPACGRPSVITADHVFAIVVDADDVPHLASYRIVRS